MLVDGLALRQARERAARDLWWFSKFILGFNLLSDDLHLRVCNWLMDIEDSPSRYHQLEIPRKHFKSTLGSIAYPIWRWMLNPDLQFLFGHASYKRGQGYLRQIRQLLAGKARPQLAELAPHLIWDQPLKESPLWAKEAFIIRRTVIDKVPSMDLAAPSTGTAGYHYHFHIYDDLTDDQNHRTKPDRELVKDFVRAATALFKFDDGICSEPKVLNLDTPWHPDDHSAMIREEFDSRLFREGLFGKPGFDPGNDGEPIHKEQWPPERIEITRKTAGRHWSAQYLVDPRSQDEITFRGQDLRWYNGVGLDTLPKGRAYSVYMAVDPNRTIESKGDWGVVEVAAWDHMGNLWLVDIKRGHPKLPEMVKWIVDWVIMYRPRICFMETISYQLQLRVEVEDELAKRGIHCNFENSKRSRASRKDDRIEGMATLVRNRRLYLPQGVGEVVANELTTWPGKHDDTLDPLADIYHEGKKPRAPEWEPPKKEENPNEVRHWIPEMEDQFALQTATLGWTDQTRMA